MAMTVIDLMECLLELVAMFTNDHSLLRIPAAQDIRSPQNGDKKAKTKTKTNTTLFFITVK